MVTFLSCPKMVNIVIELCLSLFSMLSYRLPILLKLFFLKKDISEIYQFQTVWIQIMSDILSGLIRV